MRPAKRYEVEGRPGAHTVAEIAEMVSSFPSAVYNVMHQPRPSGWWSIKWLRFRPGNAPPPAVHRTLRHAVAAALAAGAPYGVYPAGELRMAMRWVGQQDDATRAGLLAGTLGLSVEAGRVCVLNLVPRKRVFRSRDLLESVE